MTPTYDTLTLTTDPALPWSLPTVGLPALALVAAALVVLTVWTYLGVAGVRWRRVAVVLGLRLAALLLACLAVLRPSLAFRADLHPPSTLILALDASQSMTIQDQFDNRPRWDYLRRLVREAEPDLQRLRDENNVTVVLQRFAETVGDFDPQGPADGKRTDFGQMLGALYERYGGDRYLRGVLVLSDGADNGTRFPPLPLAGKWRSLSCPVHTFGFGQTTTAEKQNDVAVVAINPEPSPVAIKGKLTVKGTVNAPGFENAKVRVRLFLDDQEVLAQEEPLPLTSGNEVRLTCDAPATPGEVKVTLKVDPLRNEVTETNNAISTYVTVTKEGLSVLYVEGKLRAWEPKFIRYALGQDPRIRLYEAIRQTDEPPGAGQADLFELDKQHYDVIILGDVSARRLTAGNPQVLAKIRQLVLDRGTGLLMIGGYESFGNSDWKNTDLDKVLPVELDATGQVEEPVQVVPTPSGLRHYVLRLADKDAENEALWRQLPKLSGMTRLGDPKRGAAVLAESATGAPVLVGQPYGAGRTLAFAGDTTYLWRRSPEGVAAHARFWKQLVLWLAKQDEVEGSVWVKPDARRLAAGAKLGFGVGLRGKGGADVKDARFEVKVVGPDQAEQPVATAREQAGERGTFWKTDAPGEYRLVVRGEGKDADGSDVRGETAARFLVYQDDTEMLHQAADHDFLQKLAGAGGGEFHLAEDFPRFLRDLRTQPLPQGRPKAVLWPDWRTNALSGFVVGFFGLFVALLCLEWFLRRMWGMV